MSAALTPMQFVVGADCIIKGGKLGITLHNPSDLGAPPRVFARSKNMAGMRVGSVYELGAAEDGAQVAFQPRKWIGQCEDEQWVLNQQAQQRAADAVASARRMEEKLSDNMSRLKPTVERLAKAYAELRSYDERAAFELWVVRQLRRGYP